MSVDSGETHVRVCPGCLTPLSWYELREPFRAGLHRLKTLKTEERARCDRHGWVTWWRILHVKSGHLSGFASIMHGGDLHKRLVTRARVLAHAYRSLRQRRLSPEQRAKLRNRFRGVLVRDDRQQSLFGGEP